MTHCEGQLIESGRSGCFVSELEKVRAIEAVLVVFGNDKRWVEEFEYEDENKNDGYFEVCRKPSDVYTRKFVRKRSRPLRVLNIGINYLVPNPIRHKLNRGDTYWTYDNTNLEPIDMKWTGDMMDMKFVSTGRAFKTKGDVELMLRIHRALYCL